MQPIALQFGKDSSLLESRGAILETTGLTVVNAHSVGQCTRELLSRSFDLIVLCHSASMEEREQISTFVHQRSPSTPVLLISMFHETDQGVDAVVDCEPETLVDAIKTILSHHSTKPSRPPISLARKP